MVSSEIQLIIGLGNPGTEYELTRHNAGAWFISQLTQKTQTVLRHNAKFQGAHTVAQLNGREVHLFIPSTYMNLSGQAVGAIVNFYKIAPAAILIAHDEIDLAVGDIRLKFDGGHGGHNGLRDIIRHLNTPEFYRLRIGVGHPGNSAEVADYVLKPPKKSEREAIATALQDAEEVLPELISGQASKAMQALNTREK